jgi:hypothetical protein
VAPWVFPRSYPPPRAFTPPALPHQNHQSRQTPNSNSNPHPNPNSNPYPSPYRKMPSRRIYRWARTGSKSTFPSGLSLGLAPGDPALAFASFLNGCWRGIVTSLVRPLSFFLFHVTDACGDFKFTTLQLHFTTSLYKFIIYKSQITNIANCKPQATRHFTLGSCTIETPHSNNLIRSTEIPRLPCLRSMTMSRSNLRRRTT